jgi:uncharacterized protein YjbI with pentapeptide repeats
MEPQGLKERAEQLRGGADEAARLAHTGYLSFLLLGTYIAAIIGSTTDVQLLKVSPVTLPLLNVQLPIVGFYIVVPWLLLLIYFNLLLHFTFLAQKLHRFNAVLTAFPDEAAGEEQRLRLFPFPFSVLLIGRPARGGLRGLLGLMVWTTVVVLPLLLLLWAQVRFLPYHDTAITWNHRAAVLVDLILIWRFWPLMLMPGQSGVSGAQTITSWLVEQRTARRITRKRCIWWGLRLLGVTLPALVFSLEIAVLPEEGLEVWIASQVPARWRHTDPDGTRKAVFVPTYWLFESPRAPFHRNLWLQEQVLVAGDPSAEVLAALHSGDEHERVQGLKKITGLNLINRDLRGADLRFTLFPKGDLRGANLKGANLTDARVFAGNLSTLQLSKGDRCVDTAQQSDNVHFCRTNLQGADLRFAELQGADLSRAELQGADLSRAQLQGADLSRAQLQGADLSHAELQGATLWDAELQGADLSGAQLQGADLSHAQLQGADLFQAQLQGATLRFAHIGSADFHSANLTWSDLRGLSPSPLDKETYEGLAKLLTEAIRDKIVRDDRLNRLQTAVGQPTNLSTARSDEGSVLCDNVELFRFCVTQAQSAEYANHRAMFLGTLGCDGKDAAIARGITLWHQFSLALQKDPILMAFIKHVTAIPEKDCPGWAALPAAQKDTLRKLVAEKTSAR